MTCTKSVQSFRTSRLIDVVLVVIRIDLTKRSQLMGYVRYFIMKIFLWSFSLLVSRFLIVNGLYVKFFIMNVLLSTLYFKFNFLRVFNGNVQFVIVFLTDPQTSKTCLVCLNVFSSLYLACCKHLIYTTTIMVHLNPVNKTGCKRVKFESRWATTHMTSKWARVDLLFSS